MSLLSGLNKFLFYKNTSGFIKKQGVISSQRISKINFWEVYNEANKKFNKNKSAQQTTLMSQSEKILELSEEKKLNENHKFIIFLKRDEKSSKRSSLSILFNFNERKYKNGVRNSSDEFIYENFKIYP